MNLTGIPLRSIPAGYPRRSAHHKRGDDMRWFSSRLGSKTPASGETKSAHELAARLNRQRAKWLEAVVSEWSDAASVLGEGAPTALDSRASSSLASAFQAVHVLSLANANQYLQADDIGPFTRALCDHLADGGITEKWKDAVRHYTDLKAKPFSEQLLRFSEDVAMSVSRSAPAGMLLGPGLLPLSNEFLMRSLGITADFFGDEATMRSMAQAVRTMHEGA